MLLDMKKVKKPVVVIATTVILAIGAIGTTAGALTVKNMPEVDSGEVKGAIFDPNYETDRVAVFDPNSQAKEEADPSMSSSKLLAVSRSDEERFRPEVWQQILIDIENGEVYWEESKEWKTILSKIDKGELAWEDL